MKDNPFLVFSWHEPFLPQLKLFLDNMGPRAANALIVVPNKRPGLYFRRLYSGQARAALIPRMISFAELAAVWGNSLDPAPERQANRLDQVWLLRECVRELSEQDSRLAARFERMDAGKFLPWGLRLADLLEELAEQGREAMDLAHLELEVAPPAAALLGALGRIEKTFRARLTMKGWTTPGQDCFFAAQNAGMVPDEFVPKDDRPVLLAGFYQLKSSQDALLKELWRRGAAVCLHTDPGMAHFACGGHAAWASRWRARLEPAFPGGSSGRPRAGQIVQTFFAGHDYHSQLEAMREKLGESGKSTAIVLANAGQLMATLHHLPDKNVNLSIGYPLVRTPLYRLLETVFVLQERKSARGFYWRDLLRLFRHPYAGMLSAENGEDKVFLRDTLRGLDKKVAAGERFVPLSDAPFHEVCAGVDDLLDNFIHCLIIGPGNVGTTREMGALLERVCAFLIMQGGDVWRRFPLDAEGLYRVMHHVVPLLKNNALAEDPLPPFTLYGLVRSLLSEERVPFESEETTGTQLLGLLETRLLQFDRLMIMDATDDVLPGAVPRDALLPDSLRSALGLWDSAQRDREAAHNLFRLCAGAGEANFFWQEGVSHSALFDGKKNRSRFVEQLIWQEEQSLGRLLRPGEAPLLAASVSLRPVSSAPASLEKDSALARALGAFLRSPLSATRLDAWLSCPLKFVRRHLLRLNPADGVNEGDDPMAVGSCVHKVLERLFTPFKGMELRSGQLSHAEMERIFFEEVERSGLKHILPADSYIMLQTAGPFRLGKFLQNQPESTRIMELERRLEATLEAGGRDFRFVALLDRIDMRDGEWHVLDYKTGSVRKIDPSLWLDGDFFRRVAGACTAGRWEDLDACMDELRPRLGSLQLPVYLVMMLENGLLPIGNAAFVELGAEGREIPVFDDLSAREKDMALEHCRQMLGLVLIHLGGAPRFAAIPGEACSFCEYQNICSA